MVASSEDVSNTRTTVSALLAFGGFTLSPGRPRSQAKGEPRSAITPSHLVSWSSTTMPPLSGQNDAAVVPRSRKGVFLSNVS